MTFEYKDGIVLRLNNYYMCIEHDKSTVRLPKIPLEPILNIIDRAVDSVNKYFQTDNENVYGMIGESIYLRVGHSDLSMGYVESTLLPGLKVFDKDMFLKAVNSFKCNLISYENPVKSKVGPFGVFITDDIFRLSPSNTLSTRYMNKKELEDILYNKYSKFSEVYRHESTVYLVNPKSTVRIKELSIHQSPYIHLPKDSKLTGEWTYMESINRILSQIS